MELKAIHKIGGNAPGAIFTIDDKNAQRLIKAGAAVQVKSESVKVEVKPEVKAK